MVVEENVRTLAILRWRPFVTRKPTCSPRSQKRLSAQASSTNGLAVPGMISYIRGFIRY